MRSIKAIFIKQAKDMLKNPMVMMQFLIFPAVALIFTQIVAKPNADMPDDMFVPMMAGVFAGMALITQMAGIIAEDMERKSLRLLVMAGVKPREYLIGISGFVLLAGLAVSAVFGLIGGYTGADFAKFFTVMGLGVASSVLLGALIGVLSKNMQTATSLSLPFAIILGFTPMLAQFNETIGKAAGILYTQQLNVIINDFSENFAKAVMVIAANIAVFTVLFIIAYSKRGLRG